MPAPLKKRLLLVGAEPIAGMSLTPHIDGHEVMRKIVEAVEEANAEPDIHIDLLWLFNDEENTSRRLENHLKSGSDGAGRFYDAIMLGWGIRGLPQNTVIFEEVFAIIREYAPPTTKIMFTTDPPNHLPVIRRHFPSREE